MGYSDAYIGGYGTGSADVLVGVYLETDPDTWEDISADLISGNTIRGRQSALNQYQAGTCSLVLDNDDRTYDPTYTGSPLDGHILPMKRLRVLGVWGGESYPLFSGYVDKWTQNRVGPRRGTTTVQATDGFKVLERARLGSSAFAQEIINDGPVVWWRFDEIGGTTAHDATGDLDLGAFGSPELGTDPLIARDPGASMTLATTADGMYRTGQYPVLGNPLTVEVVAKLDSTIGVIAGAASQAQGSGFAIGGNRLTGFEVATSPGVFNFAPSTVDYVGDGLTHHIVGVWNPDGTMKIYVDGVDRTSGTPSLTAGPFSPSSGTILVGASPLAGGNPGVYDEVAIYDYALTPARIAAHHEALATPWDGDLPGERIERVLDAVAWPDDLRDIDTGTTVLQPAELDMSALEHLQKVAVSEFGNLYVQGDGTLRFEARTESVNQPVAFTFSDDPGGDLPITFSDPEISDEQIRNDVTVSRLEGVAQNVRDPESIATYQISSYTLDGLYHDDDTHSRYMAQFILQAYADPAERVSNMVVNPYRDPADLFPAVLGLEVTDRVVLNETPQHITPEVSRTLVVEGITHTFSAKSWESSFNLSESTVQTQGYWELGVAGRSELGETTRVFF